MLVVLFSFLALALAPLATPATAATLKLCASEMPSKHGDQGQMPTDHETKSLADICCAAMTPAIQQPSTESFAPPISKSLLVASPILVLDGIQPAATDPPPRT